MKKLLLIGAALSVIIAIGLAIAIRVILGGDAVRVAIEQQASAALGRPVAIQTATPRIFPRPAINLIGITVGAEREVSIDRAALSTGLRGLFSRRIENGEITIKNSRIQLQWALALLAGLAGAAQPGAAPAAGSSGFSIVSIDAISLDGVELVAAGRTLRADMQSSLPGSDRLTVTRLDARSEGSDLRASGEFTSLSARTGAFRIDATSLDVDGLLAFMAAAMPPSTGRRVDGPPGQPVKLTLDIGAKKGTVSGASFSNLQATGRIDGSNATLEPLSLNLFEGSFKGAVAVATAGREPQYSWRGSFEGLDAAQVAAFAGTSGSLTGKLGGSFKMSAAGSDPQTAIRQARGTARVVITDGRVPGLEIVRGVILAFGKPTGDRPPGSGEAFSQLATTMAIGDGRLSTNDLSFASRDFDMAAKGTLSLTTQGLDFEADLVLSRELSAQAGRDLYRLAREDDRIVLPANITGTVSKPVVFIDVAKALERAIRNRAQEQVKSIFDRLKKQIIKK